MAERKILYFSTWSTNEGITKSTIFPIIRQLGAHPEVGHVFLATVEAGTALPAGFMANVEHYILPGTSSPTMTSLFRLSTRLAGLAKEKKADVIWCRGATAA